MERKKVPSPLDASLYLSPLLSSDHEPQVWDPDPVARSAGLRADPGVLPPLLLPLLSQPSLERSGDPSQPRPIGSFLVIAGMYGSCSSL